MGGQSNPSREDFQARTPAGSVLVVDDEASVRQLIHRQLSKVGYRVHVTADVAGALRAFDVEPFDAVVSDIDLPGSDGVERFKAVRERDSDVPFVLMTGAPRSPPPSRRSSTAWRATSRSRSTPRCSATRSAARCRRAV